MAWTVALVSDQVQDIRALLPAFPIAPYRLIHVGLKDTGAEELVPIHPEIILIDATGDLASAEDATRRLALAWEIGLLQVGHPKPIGPVRVCSAAPHFGQCSALAFSGAGDSRSRTRVSVQSSRTYHRRVTPAATAE